MGFDYRPYQTKAGLACLETLRETSTAVAVLPTGAGKTAVMTLIASERIKSHPRESILILSHLSILTQQTHEVFRTYNPEISAGIHQGEDRASPMNRVIVSTMQTSRIQRRVEELKERLLYPIGLIIVDEAHHYPAASYQIIRGFFPDAQVLGFTATPFKDRRVMTSAFDRVAYSISLQEMIDMKMLVQPVLHQIPTRPEDVGDMAAQIVRLYQEREAGKRALVYMRSIEDAKALRNVFEAAGVPSRAVTSETSQEARDEILGAFRRGELQVLITVDVLTAGFDAPHVEAIFMPYGTKSPTQYLQRIGRGLRTSPGKADCRVYVFGPAPSIQKQVYEHQHWNALNAGASPDKKFDRVSEEMAHKIWDTSSEIYTWNEDLLRAVRRMEELGMVKLAEMLDRTQFPKRFLVDIQALLQRLPGDKARMATGKAPATEAQKQLLFRQGFTSSQLDQLSRYEASMMISTIRGESSERPCPPEFVMPDGRYQGRPVYECPHAYRSTVKKTQPDSAAAATILRWERRKRA